MRYSAAGGSNGTGRKQEGARGRGEDRRPPRRGGLDGSRPRRAEAYRSAVAVREFKLERGHGFADYLLFLDGKAVGVC